MTEFQSPWPESPDVYGYLRLNERGHWLIRGQAIGRQSLIDHLQRHYQVDDLGRWFVQNGWQRAFVTLAYTPWILRVNGRGELVNHCQQPAGQPTGAFLDESGALILETAAGPGIIDDNDLSWALERLDAPSGPVTDSALEAALALASGATTALRFNPPDGGALCLQRLDRTDVARHFGFVTTPGPLPPSASRLQ